MRALTLVTLALVACSGSSRPATSPEPKVPDEVIDVATLGPPADGFTFATTLHRTKDGYASQLTGEGMDPLSVSTVLDLTYTVELVGADHLRVTFTQASQMEGAAAITWTVANHGYDLTSTSVTHVDGSAVPDEELTMLSSFYQEGGFALPVREALVGRRVTKDAPVALDADAVMKLAMLGVPPGTTGELTLQGIDADGIATVAFTAKGTTEDGTITLELDGTATLEAATLLPRSLTYTTKLGGYHQVGDAISTGTSTGTSTQTFTYDGG